MTTEALVGAGLVLFRMVADNPSSARAAWMSAHLVNTFLLLAALTWMTLSAWRDDGVRWPSEARSRRLFGGAAALLLCAGVSGAVAALGDTLFPAESLAEALRQDLSPSSHIFLRLRLWHPVIAILGSGYLIWLVAVLLRQGPEGRSLTLGLGVLSLIQIAVGFVNVALLAPIWLQLTHLLVADAIWIVLVTVALSSQSSISGANLAT